MCKRKERDNSHPIDLRQCCCKQRSDTVENVRKNLDNTRNALGVGLLIIIIGQLRLRYPPSLNDSPSLASQENPRDHNSGHRCEVLVGVGGETDFDMPFIPG